MTRRKSIGRILRILLGCRAGGRVLPAVIQILLIFLWHPAMSLLMSAIPFAWFTAKSSFLWYRLGVRSTYLGQATVVYDYTASGTIWAVLWSAIAYLVPVLLEALFGWIAFRLIVRHPRPQWYRFVRHWWRTCLYGSILTPLLLLAGAISPLGYSWSALFFLPIGVYFCLTPAILARRELARRGRRIAKLCPTCQYCLRGISGETCPECGSALIRSRHGGFALDRKKYKAAETSSAFKPKRRVIKLTKVATP